MAADGWLTAVTYNVHSCVGRDGRCDPGRIADVLCEMDPDVVGLQEVLYEGWQGGGHIDLLAERTGLHAVCAPLQDKTGEVHGLGLLTRYRPLRVRQHDASVQGREPRGILEAAVETDGGPLHVFVTHFGLRAYERRHQAGELLGRADASGPALVLGDINEWQPFGRALARLRAELGNPGAPRSFPARLPLFRLDRIWVRPSAAFEIRAHVSPTARVASDHLPVVARVRCEHLAARR